MTRTGQRTLVAEAPALLNVAAAFMRETPSEVNTNAPLTGQYQFICDGKDPDSCDVTVPFHVPGPIRFDRGHMSFYVGSGGTNIIIKAALIRALVLNSESVRFHGQSFMVKDIDRLSVEFTTKVPTPDGGRKLARCRITEGTDTLYVLKFFLTKARASRNFDTARRWDERFHEDSLRWAHLRGRIDFAELPKSVVNAKKAKRRG